MHFVKTSSPYFVIDGLVLAISSPLQQDGRCTNRWDHSNPLLFSVTRK